MIPVAANILRQIKQHRRLIFFVANHKNAFILVKQLRNKQRDFLQPLFPFIYNEIPLEYRRIFFHGIRFYDIHALGKRAGNSRKIRLRCRTKDNRCIAYFGKKVYGGIKQRKSF